MNNDIADIIEDWNEIVEIWSIKPDSEQPNWDPIMMEIVGDVKYNKVLGVPMEVHASVNLNDTKLDTDVAGDKYSGHIMVCIPISYTVREDDIIIRNGDYTHPWRILTMNPRSGEHVLTISRMVGG
jgi:hypothetical protein